MKLYWGAHTRAFRIAWMMEETGLAYERVVIDIRDEKSRSDAQFRRVSPMGKVPALQDGEVRLWDSGAICIYLADQYPQTGLAPAIGDPDRGRWLQWLMFTNTVIEPAMAEKFSGTKVNPAAHGWGSFELMMTSLRDVLSGGQWILGERFSAADVMLGSACIFMQRFKMITDEPLIFDYAARCLARPACQRALGFDQATG